MQIVVLKMCDLQSRVLIKLQLFITDGVWVQSTEPVHPEIGLSINYVSSAT